MLFDPPSLLTTWQTALPATPGAQSAGVTVTGSGSANTKGSYSELITSTTYDSYGFWLSVYNTRASATDTSTLLDVSFGAAASEVDVLSNFMCGFINANATNGGPQLSFIPLFVPKGTRIASRLQSVQTSKTANVGIWLNGGATGPCPIFTACDTYGADTTDSGGTAHTPGNSGAESTDATIGTASRKYKAIMLRLGTSAITVINNIAYHWEFTDGTNTYCEWYSVNSTDETICGPFPLAPLVVDIPSGAAMQIQAEASGTAQAHDVTFHCFY